MTPSDSHRAVDAIWKMEAAKVIGGLTRIVRDVGFAEDLAQEALLAALQQWPESGIPSNPGAWLMTTAKRRAIDYFRHQSLSATKKEELGRTLAELEQTAPDLAGKLDDPIGDDLLRLIFISCHPVLPRESRAALTLRVVGGGFSSGVGWQRWSARLGWRLRRGLIGCRRRLLHATRGR